MSRLAAMQTVLLFGAALVFGGQGAHGLLARRLLDGVPTSPIPGDDTLALHNQYRAVNHAPPMSWNDTLAASQCAFKHSDIGENLASGFYDWASAIFAWYNENTVYDYSNPGYSDATGHFTQMVWVSSTQLGCATAQATTDNGCNEGLVFVCRYYPAGNIVTAQFFRDNVLPP